MTLDKHRIPGSVDKHLPDFRGDSVTSESVNTDKANSINGLSTYEIYLDGSTVKAIPQSNPNDAPLAQVEGTDIGVVLNDVLINQLPPQGSEKEMRGRLLFRPGDYPGTIAEQPLGGQLVLQGEVGSHWLSTPETGRPQSENPVTLHAEPNTAMFVNPAGSAESATFIKISDIEFLGPGTDSAGSVAFNSNFNSTGDRWDWMTLHKVVTQSFETHYNIRYLDNNFYLLNSHVIEIGNGGNGVGLVSQVSASKVLLNGTNFWTDTQPNALLQLASSVGQEVVQNCKFRTSVGASQGAVDLRGDHIDFGPNNQVDILGSPAGSIGISVQAGADNVSIFHDKVIGDSGFGIKTQNGSSISRLSVKDTTIRGGFDTAIKDASAGSKQYYKDITLAESPAEGLLIDGTNGLSDVFVENPEKMESTPTIQNGPTRVYVDNILWGGFTGGTDIGSLTGADEGDIARGDGTTGNADALYLLKANGDWQALHDPTITITPT